MQDHSVAVGRRACDGAGADRETRQCTEDKSRQEKALHPLCCTTAARRVAFSEKSNQWRSRPWWLHELRQFRTSRGFHLDSTQGDRNRLRRSVRLVGAGKGDHVTHQSDGHRKRPPQPFLLPPQLSFLLLLSLLSIFPALFFRDGRFRSFYSHKIP